MNQRKSFSQNILKSIFFLLRPFLVLIFKFWSLLISFVWLWIDLIEGNSQNQANEFLFWVFFLFPEFISVFNLVSLFVYAYICLFNLVLVSLCVLMHVRLLVFFKKIFFFSIFLFAAFWARVSEQSLCMHASCMCTQVEVCIHMQLAYAHMLLPRNSNSIFCFFFFVSFTWYASILTLFCTYESLFQWLSICFPSIC